MDTVDLCSGSEAGESPRNEIQEYDFVGLLSNNPIPSNEDVTVLEEINSNSPGKVGSESSNDTILWQPSFSDNDTIHKPSHRPPNLHNMSSSSAESEECKTENKNKFDEVITLDSDEESNDLVNKFVKKGSPHCENDFTGLLNNVGKSNNILSVAETPTIPWCPSYDLEDNMIWDAPTSVSSLETPSSSGVSSLNSQETVRKGKRRSREDKENTEREKAQRRKVLVALKTLKPGECMKYITMECCQTIVQSDCFSRVPEMIGATGVMVSPTGPPSCITWTRRLPLHLQEQQGEIHLSPKTSSEPHMVAVLQQSQAVELLKTRSLSAHLNSLRKTSPSSEPSTFTLVIYGMEHYFRKHKNKDKANWKKTVRGESTTSRVDKEAYLTEGDLEYYLAKLLLDDNISCCRVETPEEFANVLLSFTKAVAEAPYKKEKYEQDLQADFFMRGDNRDCVKVDAQGNGLLRLWSQSLCKFPLAGLEVGQAVCEAYKSPAALSETLIGLKGGATEATTLLGDIPVRRDKGPMAGAKRLGPELAKKLYTYFTATDGDTLIS